MREEAELEGVGIPDGPDGPDACVQDRPRSAVDQMGFGEREAGRTRMSVEEQLERMRRNQEASSLRERRREPLSRSASFNKDNPFVLQVIGALALFRTVGIILESRQEL